MGGARKFENQELPLMKREFVSTFSVAAIALTLLSPRLAQALAVDSSKADPGDTSLTMAPQAKAQLMVPAQAALMQTLDARKVQPGQQIRITLSKTVQLKDGPELPRGTQLVAVVATDAVSANDKSKMELRFTQAELKSGKVVPITATIVGIYAPVDLDMNGYPVVKGTQKENTWTSKILEVDQLEPQIDVELQSNIASENSGTLRSTKNNAIKLPAGSEIALAIAVQKAS